TEDALEEFIDFGFTSGKPARMRRGDIILHVCLHGTYHRGNAGILLQRIGIVPNDDRVTDYLEEAA
ncbi:MAG TPA: DinB family protein, partial [Burkholderiales bacterium]|nr:DinB family protein [Burkholderiales bacterium]